ncbi:MAG: IclR family transcriptional regulator [Thermotogae bacterium]|nr:MAG: IclR family transcriptional regulator [Thermotogota bacterium]
MAIGSVERSLKILEYVVSCKNGVRVQNVSERMGISPPTAFKHLETLMKAGYICKESSSRRYYASYKIVELGSSILRNVQAREIARPFLVKLMEKTGMTVHFVLKDGDEGVYIDKVESARTIPTISRIGMRMRLYSTGFGKAILAYVTEKELKDYLSNVKLEKQTANTITDAKRLIEELERVRENGYAIDNEENEPGIKCIGAPIFDYTNRVLGAVSVTTAASILSDQVVETVAREVCHVAHDISERLGCKR